MKYVFIHLLLRSLLLNMLLIFRFWPFGYLNFFLLFILLCAYLLFFLPPTMALNLFFFFSKFNIFYLQRKWKFPKYIYFSLLVQKDAFHDDWPRRKTVFTDKSARKNVMGQGIRFTWHSKCDWFKNYACPMYHSVTSMTQWWVLSSTHLTYRIPCHHTIKVHISHGISGRGLRILNHTWYILLKHRFRRYICFSFIIIVIDSCIDFIHLSIKSFAFNFTCLFATIFKCFLPTV